MLSAVILPLIGHQRALMDKKPFIVGNVLIGAATIFLEIPEKDP